VLPRDADGLSANATGRTYRRSGKGACRHSASDSLARKATPRFIRGATLRPTK